MTCAAKKNYEYASRRSKAQGQGRSGMMNKATNSSRKSSTLLTHRDSKTTNTPLDLLMGLARQSEGSPYVPSWTFRKILKITGSGLWLRARLELARKQWAEPRGFHAALVVPPYPGEVPERGRGFGLGKGIHS